MERPEHRALPGPDVGADRPQPQPADKPADDDTPETESEDE